MRSAAGVVTAILVGVAPACGVVVLDVSGGTDTGNGDTDSDSGTGPSGTGMGTGGTDGGEEGDPCTDDDDCGITAPYCAPDGQCHDGSDGDPCAGPQQCQSADCESSECD